MKVKKILQCMAGSSFFLLLVMLQTVACPELHAQVTIGSENIPVSGALLDLKQYNSPVGGVTAEKGLKLPCVRLLASHQKTLEDIKDANNNPIPPSEYDRHIGLTVYNIGNPDNSTPGALVPACIYVWTGTAKGWVCLYRTK